MANIWANLTGWLKQPYNNQQSALGWFGFVGVIIISLIFWGMILRTVEAE